MSRLFKNIVAKLVLAIGATVVVGSLCHATDVAYSGTFVGTEGLATKTGQTAAATYTRDMNTTGDRVSFQITYSSYPAGSSATSKTFTDGTASSGTITVSSASYVFNSTPTLSINGTSISYVPVATSSGTAKAISDAIVANSSLNTIIVSTWGGTTTGVVFTTSTTTGTTTNYTMSSSSQAALRVTTPNMVGGTNASFTLNSQVITIASNNFATGLQVLYSGTPAISGLTTGTTYFVSVVNPNNNGVSSTIKLASSLANAQSGTGIVLASSQTKTTTDTYTLAPLAFTNTTGGMQLQWSDDNVSWTNATTGNYGLAITSVTFVIAGGTTLYDLGPTQHRYLRLSETAPTTGGVTYTATDNERYSYGH